MHNYQLLKPATNPASKTICVYEQYDLPDPIGGTPVSYKRVVGYFTLESLQAYQAALAAIVAQAEIDLA